MPPDVHRPWLVVVWPGMGGVALIAGTYLARKLAMQRLAEIDPHPYFDVAAIRVREGLARARPLPGSVLWGWRHPQGGRDLAVLLGEQQPARRSDDYAAAILDEAQRLGVERVFTFAAMATPVDPREPARVFAANTHAGLLPELRERGAELLDEGEISGLNGSFLAAAAARGLEGVCLLGEFPFYASGIANPKASSAVLACFTGLAGVALHRAELDAVAARIETLFAEAARDRDRALALKAELDRHGLFMRFEDRFLDLFRQGS